MSMNVQNKRGTNDSVSEEEDPGGDKESKRGARCTLELETCFLSCSFEITLQRERE